MKSTLLTTALAATLALCAHPVLADAKPKGAKNAPPQLVANSLAGKTQNWKDCKGGIYFGPNWQAQAWCNKEGPAVGIGTWRINNKGRVCADLTWYWQKGDGVGSKKDVVDKEDCHDHVVAPDGKLWRSWGGSPEWWKFETNKSFVKGFKYKGKISRLRRKLGV